MRAGSMVVGLILVGLMTTGAWAADFVDSFDSYSAGLSLDGQGGWLLYNGSAANIQVTTDSDYSSPNGVRAEGSHAGCRNAIDLTTGVWIVDYKFRMSPVSASEQVDVFLLKDAAWTLDYMGIQVQGVDSTTVKLSCNVSGNQNTTNLANSANDWIQVRLIVAFDGGADGVNAYYKNLTDGDTEFTYFATDDLPAGFAAPDAILRVRKSAGGSLHVDDVSITEFVDAGFDPTTADGGLVDDFDLYATGASLDGQGGWTLVSGSAGNIVLSGAAAYSSPNGVRGVGAQARCEQVIDVDEGQWIAEYKARMGLQGGSGTDQVDLFLATDPVGWSPYVGIQIAGVNGNTTDLVARGNLNGVQTFTNLASTASDWIQYQIRFDFDAPSDGVGCYYKNLTDGDTEFTLFATGDIPSSPGPFGAVRAWMSVRRRWDSVEAEIDDVSIARVYPPRGTAIVIK